MNQIFGVFSLTPSTATRSIRPQSAASEASPGVHPTPTTGDSSELLGGPSPEQRPGVNLKPGVLADLGQNVAAHSMPGEGKVAGLMTSTPGPEPLTPERVGALKHELRVLDELGYLQQGHPDFPQPATHDQAFTLMDAGKPVYWRQYPNSDPVQFASWNHMEQTAQEARERTKR